MKTKNVLGRYECPEIWENEAQEENLLVSREEELVNLANTASDTNILLCEQYFSGAELTLCNQKSALNSIRAEYRLEDITVTAEAEDAYNHLVTKYPVAAVYKNWKSMMLSVLYAAENAGALN